MTSMRNSVQLIGRLGKDVELREFTNDRKMARFSLATNRYYKDKNGETAEETQWHNIVAWGKTAEQMEKMLKKGYEVIIHGRLTYRNWEDKDGVKKYTTEIVADDFIKITKEHSAQEQEGEQKVAF